MDRQPEPPQVVAPLDADSASLREENERLQWMLWRAARYAAWAWREQMRMIGEVEKLPLGGAERDDPELWIREWEGEWERPFAEAEHHDSGA
ncbi:MAG: hypothetical protein WCP98_14520 [Actinomycetes bacterium]